MTTLLVQYPPIIPSIFANGLPLKLAVSIGMKIILSVRKAAEALASLQEARQCIHRFQEFCVSVNLEFTVCAQHPEIV